LTRLDLAETFIQGREKELVSWLISTEAHCPARVRPADVKSYLRGIRRPGRLRAGIAYYAAVFDDAEHNRKAAARSELKMPVLAIAGEQSMGEMVPESAQGRRKRQTGVLAGRRPLAHRRGSDHPHARSDRLLR
jgi:pimeloyl-ACP methyl ester carboxylesterase